MKKIIFIAMMLLGFEVNAQTMEKGYLNHLLDSEQVMDKRTQLFSQTKKVIIRRNRMIFVFDRKTYGTRKSRGKVVVGN